MLAGIAAPLVHAAIPAGYPAALLKKGYLDVTYYPGVNPTATNVSTRTSSLNTAFADAYANNLIAYFPPGIYEVNNTLHVETDTGWWSVDDVNDPGPDTDTVERPRKHFAIVGSTSGSRPVIRLANNSDDFNITPKAVLSVINIGRKPPYVEEQDAGYHQMIRGINIECGTGNRYAIGLIFNHAQNSSLEDIKITATGSYIGFKGLPGAGGYARNLEVEGGDYGIDATDKNTGGGAVAGVVLKNQLVAALKHNMVFPLTLVGFEIVARASSAASVFTTTGGSFHANGMVNFIDGTVTMPGNPTAVAAFNNSSGLNIYLRNVYVTGTNNLVKSGLNVTTGTGTWKRIDEYGFCNQAAPVGVPNFDNEVKSASTTLMTGWTDRTPAPLNNGEMKTISNNTPPPDDLISRHCFTKPSVDDTDAWDAVEQGGLVPAVSESDPAVILAADLQAIIDNHRKVYLPKGIYRLTGTITLHPDTILFGADRNLTRIEPDPNWDPVLVGGIPQPTPIITTDNNANATTYLGDLSIGVHSADLARDSFIALDWQAGRNSVVHIGQVYSADKPSATRWDTHPHSLLRIRNSGGGRWGNVGCIRNARASRDPDYHLLEVTGTTQPLWIYGLNLEHPKDNVSYARFTNCSNIRIYAGKTENVGDNEVTLRFENASNVGVFGWCGFRWAIAGRGHFEFINSSNVLATLIGTQRKTSDFLNTVGDTLQERGSINGVITGQVDFPDVVAWHKRGAISDSAMVHDDPGFFGQMVTFNSDGALDGWVLESPTTPGTGGSNIANGALRIGDDPGNEQFKAILSFDTSALPNTAIIQSVRIYLRVAGTGGVVTPLGSVRGDIKNGLFNNEALENADFQASPTNTNVFYGLTAPAVGAWSKGRLNETVAPTAVNKYGRTQVRLYFATGDNGDNAADYVQFHGGEDSVEDNRPFIVVGYTMP